MEGVKGKDDVEGLIEEQFRDPGFCVKTLCTELGINMTTLHESLSVRYGATPHFLIETRRLKEALTLMKSNHSCLGAIVSGCGFSSIRTFRRAFQRRLGMRPSGAMDELSNSSDSDKFHRMCLEKLGYATGTVDLHSPDYRKKCPQK